MESSFEQFAHLLPDDFQESLGLLPEDKQITLFTRHSIREQAENYNAHYSLPLTLDGQNLAKYWGALQPFKHLELYSSPIERCVDTAKLLFEGKLNESSDVTIIEQLAEPGCFIPNREVMREVGKVFVEEGHIAFINNMLSGAFDHLLERERTIGSLLKHFQQEADVNANALNVHVSHDTILAAFVYTLLEKQSLADSDWPRMMEGVYLWFDNDQVHGVWRAERFSSDLSRFNLRDV